MFKIVYYLHLKNIQNKSIGHYLRAVVIMAFKKIMPIYFILTGSIKKNKLDLKRVDNNENYIVSLTSFPARIENVWMTIESILRQDVKPNRIILWLYKGEFKEKTSLPKKLVKLKKRGLEIKFCNENLKPHKKYYYALLENPNANIITIDDDFIFPPTLIKNLINTHIKYPEAICCSMSREIKKYNDELLPYNQWSNVKYNSKPSFKFLTMGGGGTLIPKNALHKEVFNLVKLKELALTTDDLWLKIMSLKNRTKVISLGGFYTRPFWEIKQKNNKRLSSSNLYEGQNNIVFNKLIEHYQIPLTFFN